MKILTFDLEEWFHLLDHPATRSISEWRKFDSRIEYGMESIFEILEETKSSATFFIVGWVAQRNPWIVEELVRRGFEIGSHTYLHQLSYQQDRKQFSNDVEKSVKVLEDLSGKKVESFRAPGFSITKNNLWAFEVLHENGITCDCSVFPAGRAHGGLPGYGLAIPSVIEYNGVRLKEFPINTHRILGKPFIFSGGGYFRALPYNVIKKWSIEADYVMTYFHPRDFDVGQPVVPGLSIPRRIKTYVGIKQCRSKLERWLNDFEFVDLDKANQVINWDQAPLVKLGDGF
ncbi:polysaccharide deacetylase family protein [bacterium]|nr:polysaccharide deacetylase family protein [bacterium]